MENLTKLVIYLSLDSEQNIQDALTGLPVYCVESFREHTPGHWHGEFIVSCLVAPAVADGDFATDLAPYFPQLLELKQLYDGKFNLQIAVGSPGPEVFDLASNMVAMLAILGAKIQALPTRSAYGLTSPR